VVERMPFAAHLSTRDDKDALRSAPGDTWWKGCPSQPTFPHVMIRMPFAAHLATRGGKDALRSAPFHT